MPQQDPKIQELEDRLDALVRTQIDFQKEISLIRGELVRLRARKMIADEERSTPSLYAPVDRQPAKPPPQRPLGSEGPPPPNPSVPPNQPSMHTRPQQPPAQQPPPKPPPRPQSQSTGYEPPRRTAYKPEPVLSEATVSGDAFSRFVSHHADNARANLEKFIGENLISLIGIVVLVLGVGIGAKYAIDNNLISPLARIIVGYVFGFGLVGFAIKLRRKYHNFSATLISGGMAIMYFLTYFAYSSYGLLSQLGAFGLMVLFTVCTVTAALVYNRQVIAHIGLVGAYAVPFLLSNDSGNYLALFIYMAVINTGILAISLKKNWTPIFYTSSLFTWVIFGGWFATKYAPDAHFQLALIFTGVFFAIFYATKLVQIKLLQSDDDRTENLATSVLTVVIFYSFCYAVSVTQPLETLQYWTFFTYLAAAAIAILVSSFTYYKPVFHLYISLFFSWAIFCTWFVTTYSYQEHFQFVLVFLSLFFAIFYGTSLVQTKFLEDDRDRTGNVVTAVLTGLVFYAVCFGMIMDSGPGPNGYWNLFSYLAAVSVVILATSFKFYGRVLMYLVVPCVWLIFGFWFVDRYDASLYFDQAAVFASLFFAVFYFSILFHRLVEDNFTFIEHTSLILANSFVFYGFGYAIFESRETLSNFLGLYTAANATLHLAVAFTVSKLRPAAVDVVQVLTILILTFASVAIPVQFDGNLVTMIWATEAAMLFWMGRTRAIRLFERFSYPVMLLATASLFMDWGNSYTQRLAGAGPLTPIANSEFITAVVFVAAFVFVYITNRDPRHESAFGSEFRRPFAWLVGIVGCFVLYNMFRIEIGNYFHVQSVDIRGGGLASPTGPYGDLALFNVVWQINYSIFFVIGMAAANLRYFRSRSLGRINCALAVFGLAVFAVISMFMFNELRTVFVSGQFNPDLINHWMYIAIRPMSYVLAGALLYLLYEYSRDILITEFTGEELSVYSYDAIAYTFVFIVASCELINLMGQFGIPDATKLGLSVLWGVYALVMVAIGIARDKKHLRITAFVLLAFTLVKLFFYDIADLDTIPKTILFVTLGITLLVVSFLYNKYKNVIFKPEPE